MHLASSADGIEYVVDPLTSERAIDKPGLMARSTSEETCLPAFPA